VTACLDLDGREMRSAAASLPAAAFIEYERQLFDAWAQNWAKAGLRHPELKKWHASTQGDGAFSVDAGVFQIDHFHGATNIRVIDTAHVTVEGRKRLPPIFDGGLPDSPDDEIRAPSLN
jgi:hypothetical protein